MVAVILGVSAWLPASALAFTDVYLDNPFTEAIDDLSSRGVINGFDDGTFRPDGQVTRQQFAKMIVRALSLPVSDRDVCPFTDVEPGDSPVDPLYPDHYVAVAAVQGITHGYSAVSYGPYISIPRGQAITMVVRAVHGLYPDALQTPPYSVPVPAGWEQLLPEHLANARIAIYNGLLDGLDFAGQAKDPNAPMPRGEVAQILYNMKGFVLPEMPLIDLSGTGNDVITLDKPEGPAALWVKGGADEEFFSVDGYNAAGEQINNLLFDIGEFEGVVPLDFDVAGWGMDMKITRLQVTAVGSWSMQVRPLSSIPVLESGQTYQGEGSELFRVNGPISTAYVQYREADGYFWGQSYDWATSYRSSFGPNDMGPYVGRVVMSPGYVSIQAWGPWTFTSETGE